MYCRMLTGLLAASASAAQVDVIYQSNGFEDLVPGDVNGQAGWDATPSGPGVPGTSIVDAAIVGIGSGNVMKFEVLDVQDAVPGPARQAFWSGPETGRPAGSVAQAAIQLGRNLYLDERPGGGFYDYAIVQFDVYKPDDGYDSNFWIVSTTGTGTSFRGFDTGMLSLVYDQFAGFQESSPDLFNLNSFWFPEDFPANTGRGLFAPRIAGADRENWWEIARDDWFTVQYVFLFDYDNDGNGLVGVADGAGGERVLEVQHDTYIDHPSVPDSTVLGAGRQQNPLAEGVPFGGNDGNVDGAYRSVDNRDPGAEDFSGGFSGWGFQLSHGEVAGTGGDTYYVDNLFVVAGNGDPQFGLVNYLGFNDCAPDVNRDGTLDIFDILIFFETFGASLPFADIAGGQDGSYDIFDILAYFASFGAGC